MAILEAYTQYIRHSPQLGGPIRPWAVDRAMGSFRRNLRAEVHSTLQGHMETMGLMPARSAAFSRGCCWKGQVCSPMTTHTF